VHASVPDTLERAAHELTFQITLGPALMASKGFGVPEVEYAYTRARALCQQVGHTPQLFPALWGLWLFHGVRGALQTASALGEELLQLAQREHEPAWLLEAHHALWMTLCQLGEFPRVHQHCMQGMALYDLQQHHALTFLYGGHDPGVCA
jgi:predicted ATPase